MRGASGQGAVYLVPFDGSFDGWRAVARRAALGGLPPSQVTWRPPSATQASLFAQSDELPPPLPGAKLSVPRRYLDLARRASCHRDEHRWDLLYRLLWRLSHETPNLLDDAPDRDVSRLNKLDAEVRRDCHKMKAFVRFRRVDDEEGEAWVAWHKPDHLVASLVAEFFRDRFAPMRWSILMPDESLHWDTRRLRFGPGAARSDAPAKDELEALWRDYYRAIFNPARVKVSAMKAEMPMKHWSTLPEAQDIAALLRDAPLRVAEMVEHQHRDASEWLPRERSPAALADAARRCLGCERRCGDAPFVPSDKSARATPDVDAMNAAPSVLALESAWVVCVAEESTHDAEAERAFARLREILVDRGVPRQRIALTYAAKGHRDSATSSAELAKQVTACRPWLLAELALAERAHVVALGPLVARSVLGRHVSPADAVAHRWEGAGERAVWVVDGARELSRSVTGVRWVRTKQTLSALADDLCGSVPTPTADRPREMPTAGCETNR